MNEKEVFNDLLEKTQAGKGCELKEHFENLSFEDTIKTMHAIQRANGEARKTDKSLPLIELLVYQQDKNVMQAKLHAPIYTPAGPVIRPILESNVVTDVTRQRMPGEKFVRCYNY